MIASFLLAATLALGPERPLTPAVLRPVAVSARLVARGDLGLATWKGGVSRIARDGRVLDDRGIPIGGWPWAIGDGDAFLIFTFENDTLVVSELGDDGMVRERARRPALALGPAAITGVARTADSFCVIFSNGRVLILDTSFEVRAVVHLEPEKPVAVASDGTNYVVLLANGSSTISSVAISASGAVGTIARHVDENARIETAALVSDGISYFAVWAGLREVHGMLLDADGRADGSIVRLAEDVQSYSAWNERSVDATWDGQGISVIWVGGRTRRLFMARYTRNGEIMTPPAEVNTFGIAPANPSVAFAGDHLLASWNEAGGGITRVARVELDLDSSVPAALVHALPSQAVPRAASGAETYGVVWSEFSTHLRFARFARDGVSLDGGGLLLGGTVNGYTIAYRSGSYVVIWSDGSHLQGAEMREDAVASTEPRRFDVHVSGIFPELALKDGRAVLVWRKPGSSGLEHTPMYAAELFDDGTLGEQHGIEESSSLSHTDAKIVGTADGFLLAYSLSYCSWKVCGHEMTQRFISLDIHGAPVSAPLSSPERRTLAMVRGADRVLTVHAEDPLYTAVLRSDDGTAVAPSIDLGSLRWYESNSASAAWFGDRFVIATFNDALTLTSVDSSGEVVSTSRIGDKSGPSLNIVSSESGGIVIYERLVAGAWRLALRTIGIARERPVR